MGQGPSRWWAESAAKGRFIRKILSAKFEVLPAVTDKREAASLGVVRLDYYYVPATGDIDHPGSFAYPVHYKMVPGLSFQMCQSGTLTPEVQKRFISAIQYLDKVKNVNAITGDCGFMFWYQGLARRHTDKPVLMSSLVALPSITTAFAHHEQVAIFTANGKTLAPMHDLITQWCGVDVKDDRYVIVGCEDIPGFEAVENGEKVDIDKVQPGVVARAKKIIAKHPGIRAILLECTELPPYADALRYSTGLPVYDAITTADSFIDGFLDNPRFGLDGWMQKFDDRSYTIAVDLNDGDQVSCFRRNLLQNIGNEQKSTWHSALTNTIGSLCGKSTHMKKRISPYDAAKPTVEQNMDSESRDTLGMDDDLPVALRIPAPEQDSTI